MALGIDRLEQLLTQAGHACHRLMLGPGCEILLTERGGRLFGPFLQGEDRLGWTPDEAGLEAALLSGDWNIGGERIWIAPERHFNYSDPSRMLETYRVDPALDPGNWQLGLTPHGARFDLTSRIPLSDQPESVEVSLRQHITVLPPRAENRVRIFSYRQSVDLRQHAGPDLALVPWILRQLAPVGMAFIKAKTDARAASVFGEPPLSALCPRAGFWRVPFQGEGFFKTAYRRADLGQGRIGLILPGEPATAIVWYPRLGRAMSYPESLPQDLRAAGQGASMFYDSGRFGAYGEVELYGNWSSASGGRVATDTHILHGPHQALTAHLGLG